MKQQCMLVSSNKGVYKHYGQNCIQPMRFGPIGFSMDSFICQLMHRGIFVDIQQRMRLLIVKTRKILEEKSAENISAR